MRVIHDDADLLIIDKPASLASIASHRDDSSVLAGAQALLRPRGEQAYLVHRLDRGASGVLILVKRPRLQGYFETLFRRHAIETVYVAAVQGRVERARGRFTAPPGRDRGAASNRSATAAEGARAAITDYRVVERYSCGTLVEVRPRAGRTHGIRAHLAAAGHPVLGDRVYGRPTEPPPPRLCLHARAVGFRHPRSGRWTWIEAPVPQDLTEFFGRLRTGRAGSAV